MENSTRFWPMSKLKEPIAFTVYGVIEVHADCPHLRKNWWKAARPLLGVRTPKLPSVQVAGEGARTPAVGGWKTVCLLSAACGGKRPLIRTGAWPL